MNSQMNSQLIMPNHLPVMTFAYDAAAKLHGKEWEAADHQAGHRNGG